MSAGTFPALKSGAVAQYPAARTSQYSTQVLRFLDGSEQRFGEYGGPLKRWVIQLAALDEREMQALREFHRQQRGGAGTFSFTDPWDGAAYANCSLESDVMTERFEGEMNGRTVLVVRENRG